MSVTFTVPSGLFVRHGMDTDLSEFFLSIKIIIVVNLMLGLFVCALAHPLELGSSLIN